MIKENSCIKLEYNAYLKENKQLFDTTSEKLAKENGLFQQEQKYEPIKIIVGKGFVIPGLDEAIVGKKIGEEFKLEIPVEKGFGKWESSLTENIKMSSFIAQKINPVKGMIINVEGRMGRIMFVSPGRFAKVDLNHPFAGKDLFYEAKVVEEVEEPEEIITAITDFLLGKEGVDVNVEGGKAVIKTKIELPDSLKEYITKLATEILKKEYTFSFIL